MLISKSAFLSLNLLQSYLLYAIRHPNYCQSLHKWMILNENYKDNYETFEQTYIRRKIAFQHFYN